MNKLPATMRDTLLMQLSIAMDKNKKIILLSADFGSPVIDIIKSKYPERFINVGIAEQNLINLSSGLSLEGFTVFCYAIAPFITMRCYEQIRVNLALLSTIKKINVNLIGVGAGYSYPASGPTHQCYEDISLINLLPNVKLLSPSDNLTTKLIVNYCLKKKSVKYIRLDAQPLKPINENKFSLKNGYLSHDSSDEVILISTGYMTHIALEIRKKLKKKNINITVIDIFNLKNFIHKNFLKKIKLSKKIITMEEGFTSRGGLDSIILHFLNKNNIRNDFMNIGVEPSYNFHIGTREKVHKDIKIDFNSSYTRVLKFIGKFK